MSPVANVESLAPDVYVSGTSFCAHRDEIEKEFGRPLLLRAVARLEPAQREQVLDALQVSWVPISTQQALYDALALETGHSAEQLHVAMARRSTERTVRTLWRLLLRITADEALISRAPVLFKKSYRQGSLDAQQLAPGRVQLTVSGWPRMPAISLRGLRVGIETILILAGRRDVRVKSETSADGARLEATWSP